MRKTLSLLFLLTLFIAAPLSAQRQPPESSFDTMYREPGMATLYAVAVPGGGHFYSNEMTRATMLLGGAIASSVVGSMVGSAMCVNSYRSCGAGVLVSSLGYLGSLAFWGFGIMDAKNAARRTNAANGYDVGATMIRPTLGVARDGGTAVGLRLSTGF